ncbi:MAG: LuxR C-terminal-related transcriptional regulator [Coriobacteriales bacterium]
MRGDIAVDYSREGVPTPRGVLRRKFDRPLAPDGYEATRRQLEPFECLEGWRVCLVSAAPGYGKSALLTHVFNRLMGAPGIVPLWVTLDQRDADPARFTAALGYCLSALDPRFGELVAQVPQDYEDTLVDMLNLLDEVGQGAGSVCLFLDDYGLASCSAVDDVVLFFNRNAPDGFHLVLAAQYFHRQIDDLLLDGGVVELDIDDFLLEEGALHEFANRLLPELPQAELEELIGEFGPWPLGYRFRAMAGRRASSPLEVRDSLDSYCQRFFASHVMDQLDGSLQEFLVETSLLDEMDPLVCRAVTGREDSGELLERLARENRFCRLDPASRCYRYSVAFRHFLRGRLMALHPNQIAALARRASVAYQERGMESLHAKYLVMTCDPLFLLGTIASSTEIDTSLGGMEPLAFFLQKPAASYASEELLLWCVIWSLVSAGLVDNTGPWIQRLSEAASCDDGGRAVEYARAICKALEGDSRGSLEIIDEVFSREGGSLPRAFQCLFTHMQGENRERLGDLRASRELYHKSLSLSERNTSSFYKIFDYYLLAHQHCLLGDFEEAVRFAQRGLEVVRDSSAVCGEFNTIIASVHIERGELEEGETRLRRALGRVSLQTNIDMYVDTHMARARLEAAKGNFVEALEIIVELLDSVEGRQVPRRLDVSACALGVRFALVAGDHARAYSWKPALEAYAGNPDVLRAIPCLISLAALAQWEGDYCEAMRLVEACEERLAACNSRTMATTLSMLKASILLEMGRESDANVAITHSLELSMRSGYLMAYCTGGVQVYNLVLGVAARQKGSALLKDHARQVLRAIEGMAGEEEQAPVAPQATGFWSLTEREREVMELLNQGLSRAEIARAQQVSQNTVKTHLKNIYSKLGVHSRSEVLRIAQENADK